MKRILAGFVLMVSLAAIAQTDVGVNTVDLTQRKLPKVKVTLTAQFRQKAVGTALVNADAVSLLTDMNGLCVFSNAVSGPYKVTIAGNPGSTYPINVPTNSGYFEAAELRTDTNQPDVVLPVFYSSLDAAKATLRGEIATSQSTAMGALNRNVVYVDAVAGNDSTGTRESAVRPFASVSSAAAVAIPGDTITLIRGTFSESGIILASNVNLYMATGTKWTVDVQVGASADGTTDWALSAPGDLRVSGQGDVVVNRGFLARVGKNASYEIHSFDVIEERGGVQGLFVPTASNLTPTVKVSIAQPSGFVYCFSSPMPNFPGLAIEYEIRMAKETGSVLYGVYPWSKVIRFVDSDMWQVSEYDLLPSISVEFVRCKVQANPITGSQLLIRDVEFDALPTDSTLFIGNGFVR